MLAFCLSVADKINDLVLALAETTRGLAWLKIATRVLALSVYARIVGSALLVRFLALALNTRLLA